MRERERERICSISTYCWITMLKHSVLLCRSVRIVRYFSSIVCCGTDVLCCTVVKNAFTLPGPVLIYHENLKSFFDNVQPPTPVCWSNSCSGRYYWHFCCSVFSGSCLAFFSARNLFTVLSSGTGGSEKADVDIW